MAAKKVNALKEKIVKFELIPFNYDLVVIVSDSVQESRSERNDILGYYEPDPHHAGMHCSIGYTSFIFLTYGADIGTIAHEVFHFVWRLMQWISAEHNNEVMAYHVGYYTREIAKIVYDSTKGRLPKNVKRLHPRKPRPRKVLTKSK